MLSSVRVFAPGDHLLQHETGRAVSPDHQGSIGWALSAFIVAALKMVPSVPRRSSTCPWSSRVW